MEFLATLEEVSGNVLLPTKDYIVVPNPFLILEDICTQLLPVKYLLKANRGTLEAAFDDRTWSSRQRRRGHDVYMLGIADSLELCRTHWAVTIDGSVECGQGLVIGDRLVLNALLSLIAMRSEYQRGVCSLHGM